MLLGAGSLGAALGLGFLSEHEGLFLSTLLPLFAGVALVANVLFHECDQCNALLSPQPGDCCVFCSLRSVKCPPVQTGSTCCS